jgi:hypothetical protein
MLMQSALGPVLEVDGGGTWQLDLGWRGRKLFGMRVTVAGVRSGFNMLDVERIGRASPVINRPM